MDSSSSVLNGSGSTYEARIWPTKRGLVMQVPRRLCDELGLDGGMGIVFKIGVVSDSKLTIDIVRPEAFGC